MKLSEPGPYSSGDGTSSYGYDIRCADDFKVFTNINSAIVDPKQFDQQSFVDVKAAVCIIPPNSFALARTVEYFRIPRNVLTPCLGKSTYARCGIIVNVTPLEPEWEGHVTLEFSQHHPPVRQDLRQRRRGAGDLHRVGRALRGLLREIVVHETPAITGTMSWPRPSEG